MDPVALLRGPARIPGREIHLRGCNLQALHRVGLGADCEGQGAAALDLQGRRSDRRVQWNPHYRQPLPALFDHHHAVVVEARHRGGCGRGTQGDEPQASRNALAAGQGGRKIGGGRRRDQGGGEQCGGPPPQ